MKYRHEEKYMVSESDMVTLHLRLRGVMSMDPHADTGGKYLVRSIYFDDGEQSFWRENEMGVSPREKWRIRAYNIDPETMHLECKHKIGNLTAKESVGCSWERTKQFLSHQPGGMGETDGKVMQTFLSLFKARDLRPAVIVQYERLPMIYPYGNVRVTFDRHICASCDFDRFLEPEIRKRPILPTGVHILEIKYDGFLPRSIADAIRMRDLRRVTFSKYALCRKQFML